MTRRRLPNRRGQTTIGLAFLGVPYDVSFAAFEDGTPAEVFIDSMKPGSGMHALAHDAAVLISLALQHGVSLDVVRHAVAREENGTPQTIVGRALDAVASECAT